MPGISSGLKCRKNLYIGELGLNGLTSSPPFCSIMSGIGRGVYLDAHRDDGGLHLGNDVRETGGMLRHGFGRTCGGSQSRRCITARAGEQHGCAQCGDGRQERNSPGPEDLAQGE